MIIFAYVAATGLILSLLGNIILLNRLTNQMHLINDMYKIIEEMKQLSDDLFTHNTKVIEMSKSVLKGEGPLRELEEAVRLLEEVSDSTIGVS